jgi:hypothetical protein
MRILFGAITLLLIGACSSDHFKKDIAYPILYAKTEVNGKIAQEVYIKKHHDTSDRYTLMFFKNGKVHEAFYSFNRTRNGLYMKYYANGRLAEKGTFVYGKRTGWAFYYNENGKLAYAIEFILLSDAPGGSYVNQKYYVNAKGDTLKGISNYYSLHGKDTINYGEDYELTAKIDAPVFPTAKFSICNYDSLFHADTVICETINMEDHVGTYRTTNYKPGYNVIRGAIDDYRDVRDVSSGEKQVVVHKFYFKKEFYVRAK